MRTIAFAHIGFDSVDCGHNDQFRYFDSSDIDLVRAFIAYYVGKHGNDVYDVGLIECAESDRRFNCSEPGCQGVLYTAEVTSSFETIDMFEPVRRRTCSRCSSMLTMYGHDPRKYPEWFVSKFPDGVPRP
jgi:hypothetical protein